jgi:nucleolar protein 56
MLLYTLWYGTFVLRSQNGIWKVIDFKGAKKDAASIARDMATISRGEVLEREREAALGLEITKVGEERLKMLMPTANVVDITDVELPSPEENGYPLELIVEANSLRAQMSSEEGPKDGNILSGVGALTDIDSSLNLVKERITEWYSKYWPEAAELSDHREFLAAVRTEPDPTRIMKFIDAEHPQLREIMEGFRPPEMDGEADLTGLSQLAALALKLWESREAMESYLEGEMKSVAPCLASVVGPLIGARLIGSAGGLMRLARLPSSTVQVLGAEKMFFKFLKEGGKPPKHGVLFQHPWVHSLPQRKRGKMARSLASAASLAARMDAYGGGDPSRIKKRLEKRAESIREMEIRKGEGGGRQPPFREGWWADKGPAKGKKRRGKRKR